MAVFTPITIDDARAFCSEYKGIGAVRAMHPISEGTDNSNFIIEAGSQKYILTIFESRINPDHILPVLEFADAASSVISTPRPYVNHAGKILGQLKNKPAALVEFIQGSSHLDPSADDCGAIAGVLAKMHMMDTAAENLPENPLSLKTWQQLYRDNTAKISGYGESAEDVVAKCLSDLAERWPAWDRLPHGPVHADVFPDNVFFQKGQISGVIDFYFSCRDFYIYDLMLTINAWCFDQAGQFKPAHYQSFMKAYQKIRALNDDEKGYIRLMGQAAGLRIALTRFRDLDKGGQFSPRDPAPYLNIIKFYASATEKDLII